MLPLVTEFSLSLPEFSRFLKMFGGGGVTHPTPPVATPLRACSVYRRPTDMVLASQPSFGRPLYILDGHLKKTAFGRLFIIMTAFGLLINFI